MPTILIDPSKTTSLHFTIQILKNVLFELCVNNYATYDGLMNKTTNNFKTSTTYCDKTII
jgi:hypothetical protein